MRQKRGHAETRFQLSMILATDFDTSERTELAAFCIQCAADRGHAKVRELVKMFPVFRGDSDV